MRDSAIDGKGKAVYRAVHQWRDSIARKDDESVRYFPVHFILIDFGVLMRDSNTIDTSSPIITSSNWQRNHQRIW